MEGIDLVKGLESKEEAEKILIKVQKAFDVQVERALDALEEAKKAHNICNGYIDVIKAHEQTILGLSDMIKATHIKLGSANSIEDLDGLKTELAKFVLGSGMIKLGVLGNENN